MKDALKDLVFLGYVEEEVELYGKEWKLKTLNSEEQLEASNATGNYDTVSRLLALKMEILGRSLQEVDRIKIDDVEEGLEFVKSLQQPLIQDLYEEYENIQEKQDDSLNDVDEIKN
jgi:hypothetical protein